MTAGKVRLSLVMIVRNEAATIGRCLESVRGLTDEMVVADTGSTDDTAQKAEGLGARVFHHRWRDDFSEARNAAIGLAEGDWLIMLDADETIAAGDLPRIRSLIEQPEYDACSLIVRNYLKKEARQADWRPNDGSYEEGAGYAGWIPVRLVRLWRNDPRYRFTGIIHETINQSLNEHQAAIKPTDIPIHHFGLADADRRGKTDYYLELGLKEIGRHPENFKPHYEVGLIYLDRRNLKEARDYLQRAAALNPDSPPVLSDLGYTLLQLGHREEAVRTLKQALKLKPELESAHLNLGAAYFQNGQLPAALDHFAIAVKLNPSRAQTHYNLGAVRARLKEKDRAVAHLRQALAIEPENVDYILLTARLLQDIGRPREALDLLQRAGKLKEDDPNIIYRTGLVEEELGLIHEAISNYRRLIHDWPDTTPKVRRRLEAIERKIRQEDGQ